MSQVVGSTSVAIIALAIWRAIAVSETSAASGVDSATALRRAYASDGRVLITTEAACMLSPTPGADRGPKLLCAHGTLGTLEA